MRRDRLRRILPLVFLALAVAIALAPADASARTRARRTRRAPAPPGGVYATQAVAIDPATGETLFAKDPARKVPIASITKLMTNLVFLEQHPDLDQIVEVTRVERSGAGRSHLFVKEGPAWQTCST